MRTEEVGQAGSETPVAGTPSVGNPPPAPPAPSADPEQERIDKIVQARVAEAQRSERRKVLEAAGVGSLEELNATLRAAKDSQDKNKSELEKAIAEARAETEAARLERETAAKDRHDLKVERALMAAGVNDNLSDLARLIDVPVGAEQTEIEGAVELLKTKFAPLFGRPTVTPNPSEPSGGGPSLRPSNSPDAEARGRERAERVNETQAGSRTSYL